MSVFKKARNFVKGTTDSRDEIVDQSVPLVMSFFKKARNFSIRGGTFNSVGRDQINVDQSVHTHNYYHTVTAIQERDTVSNPTTIGPKGFDAPNPSTLFQGRRAELDMLKNYFKPRQAGEPQSLRSILLYGMGGIGKTQTCLKFIEEVTNQFGYIFWIDASTPETISLGLKGIPEAKSADSDGSTQSVLQWISHLSTEWLLVFDNAEEHIHKFLPPGNLGNIILTSRNRSVGRSTSFKAIEIEQMEEEDAVTLLLKASCLDQDPPSDALLNTGRAIVKELHCLPLAVDQAGASIESGLCRIEDYLDLYSTSRKSLLDDRFFRKASSYEQTVYGTWELSYRKIEDISTAQPSPDLRFTPEAAKTAIAIMQMFAFLHHDNIMKEIFRQAVTNIYTGRNTASALAIASHELLHQNKNGEWDELHFQKGIRVLLSFSLIKQAVSTDAYTIHPLVHSWSQDQLLSLDQHMKSKEVKSLLATSISWIFRTEDYRFCRHLIPHLIANFKFSFQQGDKNMCDDNDCMVFGLAFKENGKWKMAEELYKQAVGTRQEMLGPEHPNTLLSMSNLAATYGNQGRWKEAEDLQVQVMDMHKRVLGPEHPNTLISMSNLAATYRNQGRWKEAEDLQVQVMDMHKRVLGPEHPNTLLSMDNLAATYRNQGRWKEAEDLQVQVMDMHKRVLGPEHPNTLLSMTNLAYTYWDQSKKNKAKELMTKAVDLSKQILGGDHPDTRAMIIHLASWHVSKNVN